MHEDPNQECLKNIVKNYLEQSNINIDLNQSEKNLLKDLDKKITLEETDLEETDLNESEIETEIRVEIIEALCRETNCHAYLSKGIFIKNAKITGVLDLIYADINFPLIFYNCIFEYDLIIEQANLFLLILTKCKIPAIRGRTVKIAKGLFCFDTIFYHFICLRDSEISGGISLRNVKVCDRWKKRVLPGVISKKVFNKLITGSPAIKNEIRNHFYVEDQNNRELLNYKELKTEYKSFIEKLEDVKYIRNYSISCLFMKLNGKFEISGVSYLKEKIDLGSAVIDGDISIGLTEESYKRLLINSLNLNGLRIQGDLKLHNSVIKEKADFSNTNIYGDIEITGTTIKPRLYKLKKKHDIKTIKLDNAKINNSLLIRNKNIIYGTLTMNNIHIKNNIIIHDTIINPDGNDKYFYKTLLKKMLCIYTSEEKQDENEIFKDIIEKEKVYKAGKIKGLSCKLSHIEGNVLFNQNFTCNGKLDFQNSKIDGNFDLGSARIKNPFYNKLNLHSLSMEGAEITGDFYINNNFSSKGEIHLNNIKIGQDIHGKYCNVSNPLGNSLTISNAEINNSIDLAYGFISYGLVNLTNAKIGNNLNLKGGKFYVPYPDYNNCGIYCRSTQNSCQDNNIRDCSIYAFAMQVGGNIWCSDTGEKDNSEKIFISNGSLNFENSSIKDDFSFYTAEFNFKENYEPDNDSNYHFFEEDRDLSYKICDEKDKDDILYYYCKKNNKYYLNNYKDHHGTVSRKKKDPEIKICLSNISVKGCFFWRDIKIDSENSDKKDKNTELKGIILDLSYAKVHKFEDDIESYPLKNNLLIKDFKYDCIVIETNKKKNESIKSKESSKNNGDNNKINENEQVNKRIEWIQRQGENEDFQLDSYTKLAEYYSKKGYDDLYKKILVKRELTRLMNKNTGIWVKLWNLFLFLTIGFGYRPMRILISFLIFFLLSLFVFCRYSKDVIPVKLISLHSPDEYIPKYLKKSDGVIIPIGVTIDFKDRIESFFNNKKLIIYSDFKEYYRDFRYNYELKKSINKSFSRTRLERLLWSNNIVPDFYPKFNPFIYSIDVLLPFINLGQEEHWNANHYLLFNIFVISFKVIGWILSSILVLAATGVIKRK